MDLIEDFDSEQNKNLILNKINKDFDSKQIKVFNSKQNKDFDS